MKVLARLEDSANGLMLLGMAGLPLAEIIARLAGTGVPGSQAIVQHLCLAIAFLGAALAAREGRLLSLATGEFLPAGRPRLFAGAVAASTASAVCVLLAYGAWDLVTIEREDGGLVAGLFPRWKVQVLMPIALGAIALRLVWRAGIARVGVGEGAHDADAGEGPGAGSSASARAIALVGLVAGVWLARNSLAFEDWPVWPGLALVALGTVLGGPLFTAIGGCAVLLFLADGIPAAAIPNESYRLAVSPHLPAIPLFTLTGFLLAEGDAARRLLRVFRAALGWMPGGTAVVCAALCAFMTVFTGGSGVTILVLGGLLLQALRADGYRETFSLGLLTASGSLGLLLPPALPLILFGIVAEVPIGDLFRGGILPGLLLVGLVALWGVREGIRQGAQRPPFTLRELRGAVWEARYELALPVVVALPFFGGLATLVETAALTALYALILQTVIHREIATRADFLRVIRECAALVGGVLMILAMALGLTSWMVDVQVAETLIAWVSEHIESKFVFLLCLNVFLLLVGCVMDIFSATVVVVPLIVPLGAAFGVDPVHLGILFIANLELGYLTPPVGLNLFLASYRFDKPLLTIYRAALPMLIILGVGVLVITYVPWLTTALL